MDNACKPHVARLVYYYVVNNCMRSRPARSAGMLHMKALVFCAGAPDTTATSRTYDLTSA
eukprot:365593-Chlamydomonas_euryale.AAC.6